VSITMDMSMVHILQVCVAQCQQVELIHWGYKIHCSSWNV